MATKQRKVKLSPLAIECLKALAEPGCTAFYMAYRGRLNPTAYYFLSRNHKRCTAQIRSLLKTDFVEVFDRNPYSGDYRVRITEKGRKLLESRDVQ